VSRAEVLEQLVKAFVVEHGGSDPVAGVMAEGDALAREFGRVLVKHQPSPSVAVHAIITLVYRIADMTGSRSDLLSAIVQGVDAAPAIYRDALPLDIARDADGHVVDGMPMVLLCDQEGSCHFTPGT
jgi:hypothetical protein